MNLHSTLIKYKAILFQKIFWIVEKNLHSTLIKYKAKQHKKRFCGEGNLHSTLIKYKVLWLTISITYLINLHSTLIKYKVLKYQLKSYLECIYIPLWLNIKFLNPLSKQDGKKFTFHSD